MFVSTEHVADYQKLKKHLKQPFFYSNKSRWAEETHLSTRKVLIDYSWGCRTLELLYFTFHMKPLSEQLHPRKKSRRGEG
jgi:hypothetical protein